MPICDFLPLSDTGRQRFDWQRAKSSPVQQLGPGWVPKLGSSWVQAGSISWVQLGPAGSRLGPSAGSKLGPSTGSSRIPYLSIQRASDTAVTPTHSQKPNNRELCIGHTIPYTIYRPLTKEPNNRELCILCIPCIGHTCFFGGCKALSRVHLELSPIIW